MTMGQYDPKLIIEPDKVKFLAKKAHLRSKVISVRLRSFMLAKGYLWCEFGEDSLKSKLCTVAFWGSTIGLKFFTQNPSFIVVKVEK